MAGGQKNLVLILARELASNIATPMLILDERGALVFFNEPAERVLGTTFNETGEIDAEEWERRWETTSPDGASLSLLESPLARAVTDHTPSHQSIRVKGLDGTWRAIEATVYPLFASAAQFVGAVGVFWETDGESPCS